MITKLMKLTGKDVELDREQCRKIKGLGCWCGEDCDNYCGTQPGNDGAHYSAQKSILEDPSGW
jgi:hypothetical protein